MKTAPKISIVAAMTPERVMGHNNKMPWHLPADLKHFKEVTWGKPIVMGRKTFESIGRPLPGRENIVITRNRTLSIEGCTVVHSLEEAFEVLKDHSEIMVVGGADIYEQVLPLANTLYLTRIHQSFEGDTYFPAWDAKLWQEVQCEYHDSDADNPHPYTFFKYERTHRSATYS